MKTRAGAGRHVSFVAGALAGTAAVGLVTYIAFQLHLNLSTTGFLQLLLVVLVALKAGFGEASVTSIASATCLNYFFVPPIFSFTVTDPQNWVALITFEASALVVSRLSGRAREQARVAVAERRSIEKLYELSLRILLLNWRQEPGAQIVRLIQDVIEPDAVALFEAKPALVNSAGRQTAELEAWARDTYVADRNLDAGNVARRVLRLGIRSVGGLAIRGGELDPLIVNAVASLTAIALERAHSFENESRAEAARQSEQLRTVVLDALAHAFKTPLTAIRTASSGLIEVTELDAVQQELATVIDEEAGKLNELTNRLLHTARLDASDIRVRKKSVFVGELIHDILLEHAKLLAGHPVELSVADKTVAAYGDRELLSTAIVQLIDNAAKYSTPGSPIRIAVEPREADVVVSVHNQGSTIDPEDREKVFERFYRSPASKHRANGAGLGLSITRKVAEAHEGRVWVTNGEAGNGVTFFLSVPVNGKRED